MVEATEENYDSIETGVDTGKGVATDGGYIETGFPNYVGTSHKKRRSISEHEPGSNEQEL